MDAATTGRSWNASEIEELLEAIDGVLPKTDALPVDKRTKKIHWDDLDITGRTADECRTQWNNILRKVRIYRIASEIITDARQLLACQFDQTAKLPVLPARLQQQVTGYGRSDRHPDYPKKPISAYVIFFNQKLAEVRNEHPEWTQPEVRRHICELYRLLPQTSPVFEKNEENKVAFRIAKRKFYEDHPELAPKRKKQTSLVDNSDYISSDSPPFLPASAFIHFTKKHPDLDRKPARVIWNRLPDTEKLLHIDEATEDEARYKKEVAEYKKKFPGREVGKFRTQVTRSDKELIEKLRCSEDVQQPTEPTVPEDKPYQLFVLEFLERSENKKDPNWMSTASLAWKNIGLSGQREYARRIKKMWDLYRRQLEEHTSSTVPESGPRSATKDTHQKPVLKHSKSSGSAKDGTMSALKRRRQRKVDVQSLQCTASDAESLENTSKMKGLELFMYENERDVRSTFPGLRNRSVREQLEQMFDSLTEEEQEGYNARALRFEEDFYS